jgi:hypothetical protein
MQTALDNYDLENLQDRIDYKETKNGGMMRTIIASKEDQMKAVAFILEKLPKMLQSLDELREKDAKKAEIARGGGEIPHRMKRETREHGNQE